MSTLRPDDPVMKKILEKTSSGDFVESYEEDAPSAFVGSFPKGFGYGPDDAETEAPASSPEDHPRILLMGLRRSGKSSIQKVVFHKVSPNETLFLESTNKIVKDEPFINSWSPLWLMLFAWTTKGSRACAGKTSMFKVVCEHTPVDDMEYFHRKYEPTYLVAKKDVSNSSFVQFQVWDIPGQIDFFDPTFDSDTIFGGCHALIFVIDAQDDYIEALSRLQMAVMRAYKINPNIKFEVFIHKVDGLSDDNKIETQRDIHQRSTDDLAEAGFENVHLSFHLTSIYDHSIFEAFSKVVQKLIPQLPTLENLLNILISNSGIEKAFLFDVMSKIYIATDSSPVDMQCYELCCDMIDVVMDMSCIYGARDDGAFDGNSSAIIKLNTSTILYMREVNRHLALVCILREDSFEKQGLIDYNFLCFKKAIQQVFDIKKQHAAKNSVPALAPATHTDFSQPNGILDGPNS